jgi:hypothetical protein
MAKGYFTFHVNHDGESRWSGPMSAEDLTTWLDEHADTVKVATKMPDGPNYFGGQAVIIKGEIVVPEPVQVVTKFKIP